MQRASGEGRFVNRGKVRACYPDPMMRVALLSRLARCAAASILAFVVACTPAPTKEEEEAAKNTWACTAAGERIVIRFDAGEARLLMPDGNRVFLYQIPTTSGVRFSNGQIELQGTGMDLELVRLGSPTRLKDCQPFSAIK
jgi:membrane-bound inhibitor of C-type lysozyme